MRISSHVVAFLDKIEFCRKTSDTHNPNVALAVLLPLKKGVAMKSIRQAGFTLIELIVVIVILGILAAVAIPQFIDTASSARAAARQGACSAVSSQAVLLYASTKAPNSPASILAAINLGTSGITITGTTCSNFSAQASGDTGATSCGITLPAGLCQ